MESAFSKLFSSDEGLLMRRVCATCSFVPKCSNCTHSWTLRPASRSSIFFAQGPASAVLELLVPGCVDSLSLAYFCRLSKFVITNILHFLLTQFHWSWQKSQARCFQDIDMTIAGHNLSGIASQFAMQNAPVRDTNLSLCSTKMLCKKKTISVFLINCHAQ